MDKTQEQKNIDSFNKVQQELGTGKQFVTGQGLVPQNQIPTLSKDTLGTGNQPMNIAPRNTGTSAVGFGAEITSLSNAGQVAQKEDTLLQQQNTQVSDTQKNLENSKKAILNKYGLTQGEAALTDKAYSETNQLGTSVDVTAKKLRDINSRINAIDISANEEIKALDKNFYGTTSGKNEAINAINRRATSAKADLYIDKLVTQGEYDSAKSIADRKVNVQMEQDRLDLEKLKFDYAENKDLFTKSEQRQFELMADNRKRELDKTAADAKAFETTKIDLLKSANEQNAPQSIKDAITRSTNVTEAINAAGQYSGNALERQIKYAQLNKLQVEAKQALNSLPSAIQTKVQGVAGQFDGEQAVKNYQAIAETVDAVKNAGVTPIDDIQRIYGVAKVFDPSSAVKEGEYDTVQEYATALLQRVGLKANRVFNNDGFLTPEARQFINDALDNRMASSEKAYKNIYDSYGERINKVTGRTDGKDYITDYSAAFKDKAVQTVKSNGQEWVVGKVYNDGTSNWVVDANGKWTKQ